MPGLFDLAPPEIVTETLEIRGTPLEFSGVKAKELAALYRRFPALAADQEKRGPATIESMAAMIAAGLGHAGDQKWEQGVDELMTFEEQLRAYAIVANLTYNASVPERPMPPAAVNGAGDDESSKVPAST
jgi:hypothetical protein